MNEQSNVVPNDTSEHIDQRSGYRSTTVIVHYGDPEPTVRLANQITTYGSVVIVVANDLSDPPVTLDRSVTWLVPERNLGYGEAFSSAIRGRPNENYVLLNTDIVLPHETFERCLTLLRSHENIGIVGPVLRNENGALMSGAAELSRWRHASRVLIDPGPSAVECMWVTGAVMFMRRQVAEDIRMDGSFFLGCEDADLCIRARRRGWRVICCGDSTATHYGSRVITGPRWRYYGTRNMVWFARAHFGLGPALLNWMWLLARLPRVILADLLKGRSMMYSRLMVMALAHAWWHKPPAAEGPLRTEPIPARIMKW